MRCKPSCVRSGRPGHRAGLHQKRRVRVYFKRQGAGVFREALKTILSGYVYLPNTVLGKGGHSPKPVSTHAGPTIESLDLPPRVFT